MEIKEPCGPSIKIPFNYPWSLSLQYSCPCSTANTFAFVSRFKSLLYFCKGLIVKKVYDRSKWILHGTNWFLMHELQDDELSNYFADVHLDDKRAAKFIRFGWMVDVCRRWTSSTPLVLSHPIIVIIMHVAAERACAHTSTRKPSVSPKLRFSRRHMCAEWKNKNCQLAGHVSHRVWSTTVIVARANGAHTSSIVHDSSQQAKYN